MISINLFWISPCLLLLCWLIVLEVTRSNASVKTFSGGEFAPMTMDKQDRPFTVTTDNDGNIWVIGDNY